MTISPYNQETRQRAVRLYFEELTDGTSFKAAALRAVEAVIGIKTSTIRNWVHAEEKKWTSPSSNPTPRKNAELITLRKEANEILKLASAFSPRHSSTAN
ncbi:hypothetical protein [Corynebacterium belfantii]|uniref:hypothetical protein n=1 Tax=Corynebacterium belfantii TaxID=2014537 RepID=UPI00248C189D|nr:hypothetical protein [Corynebacterium belfantii]